MSLLLTLSLLAPTNAGCVNLTYELDAQIAPRAGHTLETAEGALGLWRAWREACQIAEDAPDDPEPPRRIVARTAPTHAAWAGTVEEWRDLVTEHFRAEDVETVLCLIGYESGGKPWAYNPSGARGLMQVMGWWAGHFGIVKDDLFDPAVNLRIAALIRDIQGWWAWSPYGRGLCHGL